MFRMLQRSTFILSLLAAGFCYVPVTPRVVAQSVGASLNGQVTDTTGAAISGATVTATNLGTGLKVTATSSGEGSYRIAPLPPGAYSLSVQVAGFEAYLQQGITINVDTPATQNVSLKAGNVQDTVSVTADAQLLNTTNGSLGQTIDATAVSELPLNGRSPASLVLLAPGMTPGGNTYSQTGFSFPSSSEPSVSANGGTQGSTYFLLDGVPNMDTYLGLPAPFPNADSTQEFRVITNNFNAVYGFAPGAVVTIQTRSGTNQIHGGVFDFYRDQVFNAKNYFSHGVDPLHQNQFGGFAGGPILKNKVFIFANYQGTRNATASTELNSYVPTAAMLAGDFSGISTPLCVNGTSATCPFATVNGVPNQLAPGYTLNATAVAVDKATLPLGQQANGLTYYDSPAFINQIDEGTAKLDIDLTQKQRVSVRSFITSFLQPSANVNGNLLALNNNYNYDVAIRERYYNETVGDVWTINSKMVNSLSAFWSEYDAVSGSQANQADGTPFCWSKYINVTELPGQCFVEGFSVGGNGFNVGYYEPSTEARSTYGIYDQFTFATGKQTLSLGTNVQHQYAREQTQYPTSPILSFGGQYTGAGLADFLAGDLTSLTQGAGEIANVAGWQPGIFAQEEFRALPNLTLSAGLRWDPNFPPTIANGRASTFIPGQQSIVFPNAPLGVVFPGDPNVGPGLMRTTYGYFEPRLGVAWQPKGLPHTAIHAGFGLFTSPMIYSAYNHTADNAPFAPTFDLQGTSNQPATATTPYIPGMPIPLDNPWSASAGGVSPFPPFAATGFKPASDATFAPGVSIPATIDPGFKLATTASWNLTVEQQLGQSTVARIAYVGTQTYHAPFILDRNSGIVANGGARSTYPALSEILDMESHGTASYHALQVSVERRLSHNLQFQGNFTYAKTMDLASSSNISFGTNQLANPFNIAYNYGASSENVPLRAVANVTYTVPAPPRVNGLLRQVLGGWEVSVITTSQSGFPFTVGAGFGNNNSEAQQYEDRADVVPGVSRNVRQGGKSNWLNHYFNVAAFTENAPGTFGNSGKNIMHAPPLNYSDAGLFKNFKYRERYNLQFRWEMFNAFNHPSFAAPDAGNGDSNEGAITATGAEPARVGQMALKLTF